MLRLNDVTLVCIDDIAHALAAQALRDCIREIEFGSVQTWSSRRLIMSADHHQCEVRSLNDYNRILWYEVPKEIKTSHFLVIQYDGWIISPETWNPDWLGLDYIGAPWWHYGLNVGNGGFSLRSTQLAQFLAEHQSVFEVGSPEDDVLCRHYRKRLEQHKFLWATDEQARWFSFERVLVPNPTFGFHGIFNWPRVLGRDALAHRMALANDYVRSRVEWTELMTLVPTSRGARFYG